MLPLCTIAVVEQGDAAIADHPVCEGRREGRREGGTEGGRDGGGKADRQYQLVAASAFKTEIPSTCQKQGRSIHIITIIYNTSFGLAFS